MGARRRCLVVVLMLVLTGGFYAGRAAGTEIQGDTGIITLEILEPADGATVYGFETAVRGRATNHLGLETSVLINGYLPLAVHGGPFGAPRVLFGREGEQDLMVVAADAAGHMVYARNRVVVSMEEQPLRLTVSRESGLAPLEVGLEAAGPGIGPTNFGWDGPGPVTVLSGGAGKLQARIDTPGLYWVTAEARDAQGKLVQDHGVVEVLDGDQMETLLRGIWDAMRAALAAGDLEGACRYFYRSHYMALRSSVEKMLQAGVDPARDLGDIRLVDCCSPDKAECERLSRVKLGMCPFQVFFKRDEKTWEWKIVAF